MHDHKSRFFDAANLLNRTYTHEIHPRELPANRASTQFLEKFLDLTADEEHFSVVFRALHALRTCVTNSMLDGDPPVQWPAQENAPKYVFEAGQLLLAITTGSGLSHGEVMRALQDAEGFLIKQLIRAERHPENPGHPGGLVDDTAT